MKVRSWELTVYPRSHIRRWLGVTRSAQARCQTSSKGGYKITGWCRWRFSDLDSWSLCGQKGRDLLTSQVRLEARTEVVQHIPLLLAAGRDHCQHPFDEPAALGTVRPPADPPPDHRMPQRAPEALFVGSTPSMRAKVHRPSSTLRISKQVAAVWTQPHLRPAFRAALTSRQIHERLGRSRSSR